MSALPKFIVDVGVGKVVEEWLRQSGYDARAVRELDPRMRDTEILALAAREQRIVVTMDKDFGDLVYHSGQSHAGVLLLRMEEAGQREKLAAVQQILAKYSDELTGRFCVYQSQRLRVRP